MIYNLGSINADHFYDVPHLPKPGETLAASGMFTGLGGKGANMSVAVVRAGASVGHIGAVGVDGEWAVARLSNYGVDTTHIARVSAPTGHAIINVDASGENAIVIFPGANRALSPAGIKRAFEGADAGDILLVQNETNAQEEALSLARTKGMTTIYAAAPFEAAAVECALPMTEILVLNEVEMEQLEKTIGKGPDALGVETVVVTRGAKGARIFVAETGWAPVDIPSPSVCAVDTTGAGDTFTGYMAAGLHDGLPLEAAVDRAVHAAALKVMRKGTADVIPSLQEVEAFMA